MYIQRDKNGNIVYKRGFQDIERERAKEIQRKEREGSQQENANEPQNPVKGKSTEQQARKYQLEVLEQAKSKNTIAFLETGAGKTLIAVLLMQSKHATMKEQNKKMLAVFLVPKVPLVYQVFHVILEICFSSLQNVNSLLNCRGALDGWRQ
jgi:endoribonuclease Dicer